jgi:hypothetical protein
VRAGQQVNLSNAFIQEVGMTNQHVRVIRSVLISLASVAGLLLGGSVLAQQQEQQEQQEQRAFVVDLSGMNSSLTGSDVSGQAILIVDSGNLQISLVAKGLSPDMMHLGHIHGFMTGEASTCPDMAADANGDGVVDLIETEPSAGVTLIPFNDDPAGLTIETDTYPTATAEGLITYVMTVPLDALGAAVKSTYDIDDLALGNRVIFLHGVPEGTSALPDSAESLPGVPAYVTIPIACGQIEAF